VSFDYTVCVLHHRRRQYPPKCSYNEIEHTLHFMSCGMLFLRSAVCRLCAYIMHTAQEQFIAYVFYCEPSAGALSKTIEAACKVSAMTLLLFS